MIHDYFAASSYLDEPDYIQRKVIDYLVGTQTPLEQFVALSAIKDPTAKVEMLALAQLSVKSYAQSGDPRAKTGGIRDAISKLTDNLKNRLERDLGGLRLLPTLPDLGELPEWSFAIHLKFTLRQPYYSTDDASFYLLDNPIRKEKVFRLPYIAPTQWKGTLRSVMVRQLAAQWDEKDKQATDEDINEFIRQRTRLFMLFGSEKDLFSEDQKKKEKLYLDTRLPTKELISVHAKNYRAKIKKMLNETNEKQTNEFFAGRLQFYPSYFTQIGLEVMNPHSRKTGSGELPILFETIPKGAQAEFTLLYVPHDCIGKPQKETAKQVAEDLKLIAHGLQEMFCLYGFGAKTSSGFGRAHKTVEGKLVIRSKDKSLREAMAKQHNAEEKQEDHTPLPRYLEAPNRLKREYLDENGNFRERPESELQKMGKMSKMEYDKARRWWLAQREKEKEKVAESKPAESWPEAGFKSFSEIEAIATGIAKVFPQGAIK